MPPIVYYLENVKQINRYVKLFVRKSKINWG
jgi:hypothetical protein